MMGRMTTCSRGLGYVHEEPDDDVPTTLQLFGATRPDLLPKDALELAGLIPSIFDQGPTQSCVANAISQACGLRFRKLGIARDRPSRKAMYDGARIYAKKRPDDEMVDEGSSATLALRCLAEEGVPVEADVPLDPETINEEIDFESIKRGTTCFVSGWWRMSQRGRSRVDAIAHAIAKGYPVVFAMSVDSGFEHYEKGTTVESLEPDTSPAPDNKSLGWHMVMIAGYRTRPDGVREFLVANSWGDGWGDGGCCWMHEAVLASGDERVKAFFVIEVLP